MPRRPSTLPATAERALYALFLLLLAWLPVPLGSVIGWAVAVLDIAVFSLLAVWLALWAAGKIPPAPNPVGLLLPAAILGLWALQQALYVIPLPASWVQVLSPEAARIQALAAPFGPEASAMTLSVDPHASKLSLLKTLAYVGVFLLTLALVNSRRRIRLLAQVLVYSALVHSVYAVLVHLAGVQTDFFGARIAHGAQASGTFVNRNHFAGYLEMTLAVGIGLLIATLSDRTADSWKQFLRQTLEWILSPKMVLRLSLCVLVIALTTTHSRMGNTGFFASLLIAGVIGIVLSRHATRNTVLLLASLVIIDLAIVGSWFGVERLVQRFEQTTTEELVARETPAAHTLAIIERSPLWGLGPGTFFLSFEPFRPEVVVDYYNQAHNDYAQLAAESGLLGTGLIGAFVVLTLVAALRAQWGRRDPLMRGMSFACIMGVAAILIHSTADFNLQIPSNAAYFMVLLALGWISLFHNDAVPQDAVSNGSLESRWPRTGVRWAGVVAASAMLAWGGSIAWRAGRVDNELTTVIAMVRLWITPGAPSDTDWSFTRRSLERAERLEPDNPNVQELLGLAALYRPSPEMLQEARHRFERALVLRPVSPYAWANLATALYLYGDTSERFESALRNAAALGPSQPNAQFTVALYGLAVYDEVSPATREAIQKMVAAGMRRAPGDMLAIAQRRGRLDVACRYLPEGRPAADPRWRQLCAPPRSGTRTR